MSDVKFKGALGRFLKGDIDPINLFGLNPSKREKLDNAADRLRRADQIEFEKNDLMLKKQGGSTDPATKQVKKLRNVTHFASLSPFNPFASNPLALATSVAVEGGVKAKKEKRQRSQLKKKNELHKQEQALRKAGGIAQPTGILGPRRG